MLIINLRIKLALPITYSDWQYYLILIYAALALVLFNYFGKPLFFVFHFSEMRNTIPLYLWEFYALLWWISSFILLFLILPIALLKMMGLSVKEYGLSIPSRNKLHWVYPILFGFILPNIVYISHTESFAKTYPFYHYADTHLGYWMIFEFAYALQFLACEFFFRGFLLFFLSKRIGDLAIFVCMLPYCMIHFGKPLPECLGAIVAGIVLGYLALRTRSIYGGFFLHIAVALSMDIMALSWKSVLF